MLVGGCIPLIPLYPPRVWTVDSFVENRRRRTFYSSAEIAFLKRVSRYVQADDSDESEKFLVTSRIHTTKVVVGFGISHSDLQKCFVASKTRGRSQIHGRTKHDLMSLSKFFSQW